MGLQITFTTDGLKDSEIDALCALLDHLAGRKPVLPPVQNFSFVSQSDGTPTDPARYLDMAGAAQVDVEAAFGGPTASSAAPPAPGALPAPSPSGVTVDADGLPWDARIHSGNKETTAEGKWRKRRGVHEETMRLVTEELRATMSAVAPTVTPPPAPAPPPPPPLEPVAAKSPGELFGELMKVVAPAKNSGKLTDADIADTLAPYNIASMGLLMNRPDLIPAIHTTFVAIVTAKG